MLARDMRTVFRLQKARLMKRGERGSADADFISRYRRSQDMRFSSEVRNEAVAGELGRRRNAVRPRIMEMRPSKKNMLRQVWMTPHGGILVSPVARRPPKAPLWMLGS